MDIIQRLILVVFLSLPAFLPITALADQTPPVTFASGGVSYGSMADMCQAAATGAATASGKTSLGYDYCNYNAVYQGNQARKVAANYKYQSGANVVVSGLFDAGWGYQPCPSGSSYISGSVPTVVCSGSAPPPCVKDQPQSYSSPIATGSDQCVSGCLVALDGGRCGFNAAGAQMCFYDGHQTGASCTTGTATGGTATNDPAYECAKQGKTWGTVNGQTVCLKAGTGGSPPTKSVSAGKTTTNTAVDGTQTTTQDPPKVTTMTPPASGAADGSPPKITEETVNPDGTASKTEESADKFCESHPDNAQCKNLEKSEFSGNCNPDGTVTINCKGDAIQCNIAQKQAEMNCKIFQPDEAMTNAYNEAKNDNGSANLSLPQNASIINLPSELDASSPYAAQCNSDITFSFNGDTITLPLSAWCGVLEAVGYLFLALSYVTAAIILGGAI